jgi:hypothetical protein
MNYIQNKLDIIDIFDYIVFEYGDIDKEKSNEKLKELLTGYHNDIVEKINSISPLESNNAIDYSVKIKSLLQDTNK